MAKKNAESKSAAEASMSEAEDKKTRTLIDEVRSGGSYYSQNDLRVHFGLGKTAKVKTLEIKWLSGAVDTINDVAANQIVYVKEGVGAVKR